MGAVLVGGMVLYWTVVRKPMSDGDRAAKDLAVSRLDRAEGALRNGMSWPGVADLTARIGFADEMPTPPSMLQEGEDSVVIDLLSAPSTRDDDDNVRLVIRARASTGGSSGGPHVLEDMGSGKFRGLSPS